MKRYLFAFRKSLLLFVVLVAMFLTTAVSANASELKGLMNLEQSFKNVQANQNVNMAVSTQATTDKVAMHRLYNPYTGEHFYTAEDKEKNNLVNVGWSYENYGWYAPKSSNTPVYRLYNKYAGDHHYTIDKKEYDNLGNKGWTQEGVGWYSDDNKTTPLYRQYNPYAEAGSHNFTTSDTEKKNLISAGWKDENIAWYGVGMGTKADSNWSYEIVDGKTYFYSLKYKFYYDGILAYNQTKTITSSGVSIVGTYLYEYPYTTDGLSIIIWNNTANKTWDIEELDMKQSFPKSFTYGDVTCFYGYGDNSYCMLFNKQRKIEIQLVKKNTFTSESNIKSVLSKLHF